MSVLLRHIKNPVIDLLVIESPAKSASTNALIAHPKPRGSRALPGIYSLHSP